MQEQVGVAVVGAGYWGPNLITNFGDGMQTMDFVYSEDIARANLLATTTPLTDEVFNVASEIETSLTVLATALTKVMGSNLGPEDGPARTVNNVTRRLASTGAARDRPGFEASIDLETGLSRLVEWWRAQPRGIGADRT